MFIPTKYKLKLTNGNSGHAQVIGIFVQSRQHKSAINDQRNIIQILYLIIYLVNFIYLLSFCQPGYYEIFSLFPPFSLYYLGA